MVRPIKVIFTASDDPEFGTYEDEVILLAPDVILEQYDDGEALILFINEPIRNNQDSAEIDRATCKMLEFDFLAKDRVAELGLDWIITAPFLEVIRALVK